MPILTRWRGPILVGLSAIGLNLASDVLGSWLVKIDGLPNWLTEDRQTIIWIALFVVLCIAYFVSGDRGWRLPTWLGGETPPVDAGELPPELIDGLTVRERLSWHEIGLMKARTHLERAEWAVNHFAGERDDARAHAATLTQENYEQYHKINSLEAELHPPPAATDAELIVFLEAWFDRSWSAAINWIYAIRQRFVAKGVVGQLFHEAVATPAEHARTAVNAKLQHPQGTQASLDHVIALAYEQYEAMIRWVWFGGSEVNWPFSNPEDAERKRAKELIDIDGRMRDRLRELVARPDFANSELRQVFKRVEEGGSGKECRDRIAGA